MKRFASPKDLLAYTEGQFCLIPEFRGSECAGRVSVTARSIARAVSTPWTSRRPLPT
jgi:hypothetical protein